MQVETIRRSFRTRLRQRLARVAGRKIVDGKIGPAPEGAGFKTFLALMIALVTIIGAVVAWRSALAGTYAGNAEDAGLLASLTREETIAINTMLANQHRTAYLLYKRYQLMASIAAVDGRLDTGTPEEILAKIRPIQEQFDLATTGKQFFPSNYIVREDTPEAANGESNPETHIALAEAEHYDVEREIAQGLAEAARDHDIWPDPKFAEADALRDKSVAFIATLILLAIALWFFAVAEAVDHWIKWVWAVGGILFLMIGSAAALAIEIGAPLAEIYRLAELAAIIAGVLIVIGALVASISFFMGRGRGVRVPPSRDGDSPAEHRFKQVITAMIASIALFAALVGWLQADSGAKGDLGIRNAQRFATEALGIQATGEAKVNYNYGGAALAWKELDVLLATARKEEDQLATFLYQAVRDHIAKESELLSNEKYFDPDSGLLPFLEAYQADTYLTKKTELAERSRLEGELNNAWEDKANAYIIYLTLLAAALALFGLSMTFSGLARPIFILVGTALTGITIWMVMTTFSRPVQYTPNDAVAAYARGMGAQHRYDWEGSLGAMNEAVRLAPNYANALYERGNTNYFMQNYEQAAADFEAARAAGRDDSYLAWNLGWMYYMLGRFDDAIAESRKAFDLDRRSFGARLNFALTLVAQGKFDEARAEYDKALGDLTNEVEQARAAGMEVAPSVWFYLDAGAKDLESLNDILLDQPKAWTEGPPKEKIGNPDKAREVAEEIFVQIKSLLVALEKTGKAPGEFPEVNVGELRFGVPSSEDETGFKEALAFKQDEGEVHVLFTHEGLKAGHHVMMKVYVDGTERPEYRQEAVWASEENGEEAVSFTSDYVMSNAYTYNVGEYVVELYINSHLYQRGGFTIESAVQQGQ
jgi:tetratricopeptide (TPR) repeat protein